MRLDDGHLLGIALASVVAGAVVETVRTGAVPPSPVAALAWAVLAYAAAVVGAELALVLLRR